MIDLSMSIKEFREKIKTDRELQCFIVNLMNVNDSQYCKACYTIIFHLTGFKAGDFPGGIKTLIEANLEKRGGRIKNTFFGNNYIQRVYMILGKKKESTEGYFDIYYNTRITNPVSGTSALYNGRGFSKERLSFVQNEIEQYSIQQALSEIERQFVQSDGYKDKDRRIESIRDVIERIYSRQDIYSFEPMPAHNTENENGRDVASTIEEEIISKGIEGEVREVFVKARVNQGVFRDMLLKLYNSKCCLCGIAHPRLLIASHIKPWANCSPIERTDIYNGFLFCANHDKLFDKGYISFDDNGNIIISDSLSESDKRSLGINGLMSITIKDENKKYLDYHRRLFHLD